MPLGRMVPGAMFSTRDHSLYLCLTYFIFVCLAVCLSFSPSLSVVQCLDCNRLLNCDGSVNCRVLLLSSYALGFARCILEGQSMGYITLSAYGIKTAQTMDCIYIWHICTRLLTGFAQLFICSIGFPWLWLALLC